MAHDVQFEAIELALQNNDLRKAEILIAKALRPDDLDHETRALLLQKRAQVRLAAGRPDDALSEIEEALILKPEMSTLSDVKLLLGDIYFAKFVLAEFGFADRNDTETALNYYNDIIKNDPSFAQIAWVYYQRGCIYLSENAIEAAIENLKQALSQENNPSYVHAYAFERLGYIALYEQRIPEQAVVYFEQAAQLYPKTTTNAWITQLHILRSRAFREVGDYEQALAAASTALQSLDPNAPDYKRALPETHLAIGEVLALIPNREAEAIEHLLLFLQNSKRPLGIDVTWSRVHELIGDLSMSLKQYEQAIEAYQTSLQFNPDHPWEINIRYQIARCYYRMKAYERVIAAIEQMQATAAKENLVITDYRVFYILGNAYFALERYLEATEAYQEALRLAPPNADHYHKIIQYLGYAERLQLS